MAGISTKASGKIDNKISKYNGYEFNNEFDINLYESFYRLHDPQIGRFWQLDPKSEKYFFLSSFIAMGNNPISIFDILGDDLELTGKQKNVKKALEIINKIFDGHYTASVDKKGKIHLVVNEKEGEASKQAFGLFTVMKNIVENANGTTSIEIVNKDSKVDIDDFQNRKIDISDIETIGNGEYASSASMLGHAFAEQESLQIENKGDLADINVSYSRDHPKGVLAEELITGYSRSSLENNLSLFQNFRGNTSGALGLNYYQTILGPNGKVDYLRYHVDIKFKNGNIKKVTSGKGFSKL